MAQIYITHGYKANGDKHWFPWLAQELSALGIPCQPLTMPNPDNPTPEEWLSHHQHQVTLTEETILVGHSLGCIATLNFLAKSQKKIKGIILVSGFYQTIPHLPELAPFVNFSPNLTAYLPKNRVVIASLNDEIVPHPFSDQLAQYLNADYLRLPEGKHFCEQEGVTKLPAVLDFIQKWGD